MYYQGLFVRSRGIVGLLVLVTAFVVICPNASAIQQNGSPNTASGEGTSVSVFDLDYLNLDELKTKAESGMPIAWNVLGRTIQYSPVPITIEDAAARSIASQQDPHAAKTYAGIDSNEVVNVRMTVSSDWVHVSFTIDNVDYMIDRIDGADGSNQYYVHSLEDSADLTQYSDPFDAVAPRPGLESVASFEMEPAEAGIANSSSVLTTLAAQVPLSVDVGASSTKEPKRVNGTSGCGDGDPVYRLATIICAADAEFRALYPNDWQNRILAVVNDMGGRYESQVLISFRISQYAQVNFDTEYASTLLFDFEEFMDTNPAWSGVQRSLAHLFSGKDLLDDWGGTGVMGVSYEAGVRRATFDNVFHEDIEYGLAYSLSEQWHDSSANMWLLGHEIGHNFNGESTYHVHFPVVYPWYIDSWMADTFGTFSLGGVATFSDNNKARIKSWASQGLDHIRTSNPTTPSVSGDNLQSSNIYMELSDWGAAALPVHEVGKQMKAAFTIKNVGSSGLTLSWLFVGARDASGNNRDFGHIYNVYLAPQQVYSFSTSYTPASGGTWTMWPAYKISGHYGPYQWIVINPALYYKQLGAEWKDHADTHTSSYMDLWYRFLVLTPTATPTRGSTVTVSFTLFNSIEGTSTTTYTYIFTAARINMQESYNRDFGHSGQQVMTQNCTGADPTGGGYHLLSTRTLDLSGTWYFWPCYSYNGWGPWQWHYLSIVVP